MYCRLCCVTEKCVLRKVEENCSSMTAYWHSDNLFAYVFGQYRPYCDCLMPKSKLPHKAWLRTLLFNHSSFNNEEDISSNSDIFSTRYYLISNIYSFYTGALRSPAATLPKLEKNPSTLGCRKILPTTGTSFKLAAAMGKNCPNK